MKSLFLLSAAALAVPIAADAQTADGAQREVVVDEVREVPIIVTAGAPQYYREIGQDVSIVTRETIEQRQAVQLSDLLATLPGISVTRNGGPGGFTGVRLRGAEGEQTLTIIDGVRVNDPSSPGGGFDFANLLAGGVDRIEVLRGPDSVPWGSQAIGGVINIVTAEPRGPLEAQAAAEYGSFNSVFANARIAASQGSVSGALTAGYLRTDGISAAANGSEPDGYRQAGATGRLDARLGGGFALHLRGYYAHSRIEQDGFPPPTYQFADDGEYAKTQEVYGYAGAESSLLDGRLINQLAVTLADVNRDNFDPSLGTAPSFFARGRSERYAYQGVFRAIEQARLILGAEHEDSRMSEGSIFAPGVTNTYRTGVTSVYGEAIVTPVDAVTVTAGARHDQHRDYGSHWTFSANTAVRPIEGTTLRASYAEGFKAPTLYQLFAPFYGTRTLVPETAQSYDVGVEQRITGTLRFSATWFHRDTHNQIAFDLNSYTYHNIAAARAKGLELSAEARAFDGLTLSANYTHLVPENRSADANFGHDLQRRPRDMGSISADYRFDGGYWFGGTLLAVGDSFDDPANSKRLAGYVLASVRAEAPIGKQLVVYGRVENLFDRSYQTVAGYGTPGRAVYAGIRLKTR